MCWYNTNIPFSVSPDPISSLDLGHQRTALSVQGQFEKPGSVSKALALCSTVFISDQWISHIYKLFYLSPLQTETWQSLHNSRQLRCYSLSVSLRSCLRLYLNVKTIIADYLQSPYLLEILKVTDTTTIRDRFNQTPHRPPTLGK